MYSLKIRPVIELTKEKFIETNPTVNEENLSHKVSYVY